MQNRMLFRVLIIVGILANFTVVILCASEKTKSATVETWAQYSSKEGKYSIAYPEGWAMQERSRQEMSCSVRFRGHGGAIISITTTMKDGALADITKPNPFSQNSSVKGLHDVDRKVVLPMLGMKVASLDAKPISVGGRESYATDFEFQKYNGLSVRKMKGMLVTAWNGDHPITIMFACPEGDYPRLLEAFKKMLMSFQPAEQTPVENPMEQLQQMMPQQPQM